MGSDILGYAVLSSDVARVSAAQGDVVLDKSRRTVTSSVSSVQMKRHQMENNCMQILTRNFGFKFLKFFATLKDLTFWIESKEAEQLN